MKPCSNRPGKSWQRLYGMDMNNARLSVLYVMPGNSHCHVRRSRSQSVRVPSHASQGRERNTRQRSVQELCLDGEQ